jgi:hypothetical protein
LEWEKLRTTEIKQGSDNEPTNDYVLLVSSTVNLRIPHIWILLYTFKNRTYLCTVFECSASLDRYIYSQVLISGQIRLSNCPFWYNRTSYTYSITGRPDIGFIE